MTAVAPDVADETSAAYQRLEEQLNWYDSKAELNQGWYRRLKVLQLVAAAVVPVAAGQSAPAWVTGGLGALIVVVEGIQQLFQLQPNWSTYRSTCEALKHEKFLYLASAGPYREAEWPEATLAERVENLVSQETVAWADTQRGEASGGGLSERRKS